MCAEAAEWRELRLDALPRDVVGALRIRVDGAHAHGLSELVACGRPPLHRCAPPPDALRSALSAWGCARRSGKWIMVDSANGTLFTYELAFDVEAPGADSQFRGKQVRAGLAPELCHSLPFEK